MSGKTVCVHGLGYIGLSTATVLAHSDNQVYGYDTDESLLRELEHRTVSLDEPGMERLVVEAMDEGTLTPVRECRAADYHLLCVPTPVVDRRADLSAVTEAAETATSNLRPGDVVVLESTVPPGTTVKRVLPLLEADGPDEFGLVYAPETVLPGRILTEVRENDRLVGGVDAAATKAGVDLYESFVEGRLHTTDATTAEFAKLAQNTYRDVNIALANEFAKLTREHDVDPRRVIELGNTNPRVDIHTPGPGPGGHCVPVDPWFLCEGTSRETLIEYARQLNDEMVSYVCELVGERFEELADRRISVLGAAYKGGVADARNSPGIRLADELRDRYGAKVRLHDPHVSSPNMDWTIENGSVPEFVAGSDAIVVTTDHDEYRDLHPGPVREGMRTLVAVDTKDVLDASSWREVGFEVARI
ncbi:nucleotide sugar dehydrogenase [Halorubrum sp. DTA98]|uniref:nucleotide sugar dehydrogenase n=1 Tax=Halorubrum sp. DTA98 TaxID=3402163 RepID=UPI003AAA804B